MANNNDKFISRENAKTLWGYMIDLLTGKQNKLTFDDTPTQSSDNPVKSGGIFTALAGKGTYSKPQNGIPKTDLENAVQTSLGLADSALQSETDPTVPSWAKQTNKPSYTQDEVGDGTTYKRVNQTEKDTWSGKQNALSTTQMQAVNSGITSAGVTQISTNQANILYSLNTGVKNALVIPDRTSEVNNSTLKFVSEKGIVTVTGTNASSTAFFTVNFTGISGRFKLNGCPSGGSDNTYLQRIYTADGSLAIGIDRGSGTSEFTLNPNVEYQWTIRINANYAIQNSLVFKPMLYQADTDGSTFQTGALPNSDLTRLEAEDRAALAEEIDAGAKNLWANGTSGTISGWRATFQIGQTLKKGTYIIYFDSLTSTDTDADTCQIIAINGTTQVSNSAQCPRGNKVYTILEISADANALWIYSSNSSGTGDGDTANFTNGMICTKAAFIASQKFVPWQAIPKVIYHNTTKFTASTTMTYTGISYTIPANTAIRITASALNLHGNPDEIAIASYSNQNIYLAHNKNFVQDKSIASIGTSWIYTTGASTYGIAILAKFAAATENSIELLVEKLN